MINLNIKNETDTLEAVVLGIAKSSGPVPGLEDTYDPKSREFLRKGEYPKEEDMQEELDEFYRVLRKYHVEVYRPELITGLNQIFSRDVSFVIDDVWIVPNVLENRLREVDALQYLMDQVDPAKVIKMPANAKAEGGDVMVWNEYLFVGYSDPEDFEKYTVSRTNVEGVNFLRDCFPDKKVKAFQLNKSDSNPRENALHLDCCFQPVGKNKAILYKGGFKHTEDVEFLVNYFGKENIIEIDQEEMYGMNTNVFSISPEVVVSERSFTRLNEELRKRAFIVEEIPFFEISKQEGLLRCATMPLRRK